MSAAGGFGTRLRQEREARGVSLDELSRATKIRRVLLEALEAERWEGLPARVFVLGYLRAIAEHLHADPEALQVVLEEAWPAPGPAPRAQPEEALEEPAGSSWAWIGLAAGVSAAGIALWFYLRPVVPPEPPPAPPGAARMAADSIPAEPSASVSGMDAAPAPGGEASPASETAPEATAAPSSSSPVPAPAGVPATGQASAPGDLPPAAPASPPGPAPAPHGDLWIEVSAPCWMELFAGERRLVLRQVQAGEQLSFDGSRFTLTVGDASACRVLWKGSAVKLPTEQGKVVRGLALGEEAP